MFGVKYITKSNSGFSFIEENWRDEYSKILGYLNIIAQNHWAQKSREFTIIIESSINDNEGYIIFDDVNIYGMEDSVINKRNQNGEIVTVLKLVEGNYNMNYKFLENYGALGIDIYNHKGLRIFSKNRKLCIYLKLQSTLAHIEIKI